MDNLVNQSTVSQHYLLDLVLVVFFLSSVNMFEFFCLKMPLMVVKICCLNSFLKRRSIIIIS